MELECSPPYLKKPVTGLCPQLLESSPIPCPLFLRFILIVSSQIRFIFKSSLFLGCFVDTPQFPCVLHVRSISFFLMQLHWQCSLFNIILRLAAYAPRTCGLSVGAHVCVPTPSVTSGTPSVCLSPSEGDAFCVPPPPCVWSSFANHLKTFKFFSPTLKNFLKSPVSHLCHTPR
jgi:hypothetical protein